MVRVSVRDPLVMGAGVSCEKPLRHLPERCTVDPRCGAPSCQLFASGSFLTVIAHSVKLSEDADTRHPCDPVIEVALGTDSSTIDVPGSGVATARTPIHGTWRSKIGGWEWGPPSAFRIPFGYSAPRLAVRLLMRVAPPGFDVNGRQAPRELTCIASAELSIGDDVLPRTVVGGERGPMLQGENVPMPVLLMSDCQIAGIAVLSFELLGGGGPPLNVPSPSCAVKSMKRPRTTATSNRDNLCMERSVSSKDLESFPSWRLREPSRTHSKDWSSCKGHDSQAPCVGRTAQALACRE